MVSFYVQRAKTIKTEYRNTRGFYRGLRTRIFSKMITESKEYNAYYGEIYCHCMVNCFEIFLDGKMQIGTKKSSKLLVPCFLFREKHLGEKIVQ